MDALPTPYDLTALSPPPWEPSYLAWAFLGAISLLLCLIWFLRRTFANRKRMISSLYLEQISEQLSSLLENCHYDALNIDKLAILIKRLLALYTDIPIEAMGTKELRQVRLPTELDSLVSLLIELDLQRYAGKSEQMGIIIKSIKEQIDAIEVAVAGKYAVNYRRPR